MTRFVGVAATAAGLLPIAVGYLLAHYFTYVLIDHGRALCTAKNPKCPECPVEPLCPASQA